MSEFDSWLEEFTTASLEPSKILKEEFTTASLEPSKILKEDELMVLVVDDEEATMVVTAPAEAPNPVGSRYILPHVVSLIN
jgi:hypothetical protein